MPGTETPTKDLAVLFSKPFLAVCSCVIVLCGVVIGLWSTAIEQDRRDTRLAITDIREILDARASLILRTTELEKRTDDHEERLRRNEQFMYRHGH